MKRVLIICAFLAMTSHYSFSQNTLIVEIIEIRNNTGNVMLQLFDEKEKVVTQERSLINDKKCEFTIKNLKPGRYAVRYYHDENINKVMDTNLLGKPTEGYGFSNNVIGKFGPPPFEKWLFNLTGDKKISLKPTY
jgi:uncharacterized protein (DUF2141 family)